MEFLIGLELPRKRRNQDSCSGRRDLSGSLINRRLVGDDVDSLVPLEQNFCPVDCETRKHVTVHVVSERRYL